VAATGSGSGDRADADRSKARRFLALPPDEQKLTRRPEAKILSDKDRIATSKRRRSSGRLEEAAAEPASGAAGNECAGAAGAGANARRWRRIRRRKPAGNPQGICAAATERPDGAIADDAAETADAGFQDSDDAGSAIEQAERQRRRTAGTPGADKRATAG